MQGDPSVALVAVFATVLCAGAWGGVVLAVYRDIDYEGIRASKRVVAVRVDHPIIVDGRLDEEAWHHAVPAVDFYQQQPDEGALATEPSEVCFLYDQEYLYIGGTFYDSEPVHGPITNELKRDFSGARDGDFITVVLDTFHDERNATNFMTNPAGALRDSQSYDDGRQINANWDGVWFIKTARFARGWAMEMAVPFKTLRFPDRDTQLWGLNILRVIRRKNEITFWSPVPRQFTQFKVSYAGVLEGISGVRPGRNLRIKPFAISDASRGVRPGKDGWSADADAGIDLKYGLDALTLDATYRTDFSQVEADEQQINLTRFSLFFAEKREFFLENQGAFRVGDQAGSGFADGGRRPNLLPFFSRRIGLSGGGQPIPIFGGLRLTGKQGHYGLGLLFMGTEATEAQPSQRFTALRLGRDLGAGSSVGAFYFGREGSGDHNRVGGADLHLNFNRTRDLDLFFLKSSTPGKSGRDRAGRAAVNVVENLYTARLSYTNIAQNYQNDLGFVGRDNVALLAWEFEQNIRPRATQRVVRTFTVGGEGDFIADSGHERLISRVARHDYSAEFADGGRFGLDFDWNYEYLAEPFEISAGVFIPAGVYRFWQANPSYSSDRSRWLSGNASLTLGEFWSGNIRGANTGVRVRFNEHMAISGSYGQNHVTLQEADFTTKLARLRVDNSFSTRMFLNGFVQYNSASRAWLSNIRFNLMHRPLSDIFVVFNETRAKGREPVRAFIVKYTHLISF